MKRRSQLMGPMLVAMVCVVAAAAQPVVSEPDAILARATRYVTTYERAFTLMASEELYEQEVRRPPNPGSNLSRTNPGGGMLAGGTMKRVLLRSDYALAQLGDGAGWLPIRDVFEVNGATQRQRDDRLVTLLGSDDVARFDKADRLMDASTKWDLGDVTRTINIPTLGLMFLHPIVKERFAFESVGEEMVGPRRSHRFRYRETARPTLIKTTRGRDLVLEGDVWIDPSTGVILKTLLNAADPVVRAMVTVTFRREDGFDVWVPASMEEYYKAAHSVDEIFATATYSNVRRIK